MNYHIEIKDSKGRWSRIASFENFCDRDDCKAFLAERYEDCKFRADNEEE